VFRLAHFDAGQAPVRRAGFARTTAVAVAVPHV